DGQLVGARPLDVQTLLDRQLVAGQGDGLAVEAGREDDGVAVLGVADRVPQGAGPGVVVVQDRQRAGKASIFEDFETRKGPVSLRNVAAFLLKLISKSEPHRSCLLFQKAVC